MVIEISVNKILDAFSSQIGHRISPLHQNGQYTTVLLIFDVRDMVSSRVGIFSHIQKVLLFLSCTICKRLRKLKFWENTSGKISFEFKMTVVEELNLLRVKGRFHSVCCAFLFIFEK